MKCFSINFKTFEIWNVLRKERKGRKKKEGIDGRGPYILAPTWTWHQPQSHTRINPLAPLDSSHHADQRRSTPHDIMLSWGLTRISSQVWDVFWKMHRFETKQRPSSLWRGPRTMTHQELPNGINNHDVWPHGAYTGPGNNSSKRTIGPNDIELVWDTTISDQVSRRDMNGCIGMEMTPMAYMLAVQGPEALRL